MGAVFSSREFNQDASRVKRATAKGPVFITDRGRPAHVLMTVKDYERMQRKGGHPSLVDFMQGLDALAELDLTRDRDTGRDPPF